MKERNKPTKSFIARSIEEIENKFNFNSAICTSREQSERLLKLGLKKETADMYYKFITHDFKGNEIKEKDRDYLLCCWYDESSQVCGLEQKKTIPAWSLHRLWELYWSNKVGSDCLFGCGKHMSPYAKMIAMIEYDIEDGTFNKDYLEK